MQSWWFFKINNLFSLFLKFNGLNIILISVKEEIIYTDIEYFVEFLNPTVCIETHAVTFGLWMD